MIPSYKCCECCKSNTQGHYYKKPWDRNNHIFPCHNHQVLTTGKIRG